MAKGDKKASRKRRSKDKDSGRKPDGNLEMGEPKLKKRKAKSVVYLGHSRKISERSQLTCLAALLSKKKTDLRVTNKMEDVLEDDASITGLYLEEAYMLYASSRKRSVVLQFELLAIAGPEPLPVEIEIKNPLLVFSDGFGNSENWENTKMMLFELFSKSDSDANCDKDYIYAFTRSLGKVYFRIYKINSLLDADQEESLEQVYATFVLKPVEIRCLSSDSIDYFLNKEMFLISQGDNSLNALSSGTIQHVEYQGLNSYLLASHPDLSEWEGFNTNVSEFFTRFHAFKCTRVPGTGPERCPRFTMAFPEAYYWHLCPPFKVYARSLIVCVGSAFKIKACYDNIKEENIFFRGKTVKIRGARLIDYTLRRAINNMNSVGHLIEQRLMKMGLERKHFPADLHEVLQMLERNPLDNDGDLEQNPVENCDLIKNFICWMDSEERIHVMDDLVQDFLYRMGHYDQMDIGLPFPPFSQWVDMFCQNNYLLRICREYSLPKTKTEQHLNDWIEKKRNELLEFVNNVKDDADRLYSCREYFKAVNNALKHLLQTKFDKDRQELSTDEIDLIVSSQFAATYAHVQVDVPKALASVDPERRGSYKRFASFFPPDDAIQFKNHDEKGECYQGNVE